MLNLINNINVYVTCIHNCLYNIKSTMLFVPQKNGKNLAHI